MLDDFNPKRFLQPAKAPQYGEAELAEAAKSIFSSRGIEKLYAHQAEGIKLAKEGKNVAIVAPTASGKSEIYMSAIIDAALSGQSSLVIYPTKALSRDQMKRFEAFALYGIRAEIYDGDVSDPKREKIRKTPPQVLITNFDMLHFMLMGNSGFQNFFRKLRLLVVDELHTYTGVFGGHASNIIWRLKRLIQKKYKSKMQFICTSATIGNAKEFAELIFKERFEEVRAGGAGCGEMEHVLISPEGESYTTVSLRVAEKLERKTLLFANSHSVVERLGMMAKRMGLSAGVYRAGLDPEKRRQIESGFRSGAIRILATTSALELGMDIGDVDAVILAGFPGTITRVKQRVGRAGRKGQKAYGVYVARDNPLDQYYYDNPSEYLNGEPENCFANPDNENIAKMHLLAAAKDTLLGEDEARGKEGLVQPLVESGLLKKLGKFYFPTPSGIAAVRSMGIRGIGKNIRIIDSDKEKQIGEREFPMAVGELFEGALYLHGGEAYMSEQLDLQYGIAKVRKLDDYPDFYTQPLSIKEAEVIEELQTAEIAGFPLHFGKIHVKTSIHGFLVKEIFSGSKMGEHSFPEPYEFDFDTLALWIDFDSIVSEIRNFGEGLHGFEHVFISMAPALSGADGKELGGLSYPSGRMYVYDSIPDGSGAAEVVFKKFSSIAAMAEARLKNCGCGEGCPKCILDPLCGNDNRFLDKRSALEIAKRLGNE